MMSQLINKKSWPVILTGFFLLILFFLPNPHTNQEQHQNTNRVKAEVITMSNDSINYNGLIRTGEQWGEFKVLQGDYKGDTYEGVNLLTGKMEMDKLYEVGDSVFVVLDIHNEQVTGLTPIDHYRLSEEILLVVAFIFLLLVYARSIGLRAIFSFAFTVLMIWKVLLPAFLSGYNPIIVSLAVTLAMTIIIILLVYGPDRRSLAAITGSIGGTIITCIMALIFVSRFRIHGAVMPYSESLLYAGFPYLNLTAIFTACIFIASSGALMDLAVDITSSVAEVIEANPKTTRKEAIQSGLNVGRSVIGTMTTTLLLAYSGGYMALMMVFMAQGTPMLNILNLKFIASEILHTLIGSFGLVTVAPLTALTSGFFLVRQSHRTKEETLVHPTVSGHHDSDHHSLDVI